MIGTNLLYTTCHQLFNDYPRAVRAANSSGTIHLMVLLLEDGDSARFFVLSRDGREDKLRYALRPWRAPGVREIRSDDTDISDAFEDIPTPDAVLRGVPLPQDESLFGWRSEDRVVGLIVFYTRYTAETPEPSWAVMPATDIPRSHWPPFTLEKVLGHWFWDHFRAGRVVSVEGMVAEHPATAFWVDTREILGSNCCVVANDLVSPDGFILRRGRYVYHEPLRADTPIPSLETMLADLGKVDLSLQFRPLAQQN